MCILTKMFVNLVINLTELSKNGGVLLVKVIQFIKYSDQWTKIDWYTHIFAQQLRKFSFNRSPWLKILQKVFLGGRLFLTHNVYSQSQYYCILLLLISCITISVLVSQCWSHETDNALLWQNSAGSEITLSTTKFLNINNYKRIQK